MIYKIQLPYIHVLYSYWVGWSRTSWNLDVISPLWLRHFFVGWICDAEHMICASKNFKVVQSHFYSEKLDGKKQQYWVDVNLSWHQGKVDKNWATILLQFLGIYPSIKNVQMS